MDSRLGLPVNTILDGTYRIEKVLGSGAFGIVYQAEDLALSYKVAIKEYFPFDVAGRDATMGVQTRSHRQVATYEWGRSNFLREARTLARFEHASIVRVTRVFEANSTAYMVMRFEEGPSFADWLSRLGRLPTQEELDRIAAPLLDALDIMHEARFLHRDLAPDNIIISAKLRPVLLDFGAADRQAQERSRTRPSFIKAGYSPIEQYVFGEGLQEGPWSDIYSFGATFFRALRGFPLSDAPLRIDEKDFFSNLTYFGNNSNYRSSFLATIDNCIFMNPSLRPQNIATVRSMLFSLRQLDLNLTPINSAAQRSAGKKMRLPDRIKSFWQKR
jgi:serine/threonine protein kinase